MRVPSDYKPTMGDLLVSPERKRYVVSQVAGPPGDRELSLLCPPEGRFPGECVMCKIEFIRDWEIVDKVMSRKLIDDCGE